MLTQLTRIHRLARRIGGGREGSSSVEFSLAVPFLILVAIGAYDYGSAYVEGIRLNGAAHAGAQQALYDPNGWDDTDTLEHAALEEYVGAALTDDQVYSLAVSAAATTFCACAGGLPLDCSSTCPSGDAPGEFVRVAMTRTLPLTLRYPWAGDGQVTVDGEAVARVR